MTLGRLLCALGLHDLACVHERPAPDVPAVLVRVYCRRCLFRREWTRLP